jgi:hypothetical protein
MVLSKLKTFLLDQAIQLVSVVSVLLFCFLFSNKFVSNLDPGFIFFDFKYVTEYADAFWRNPSAAYVFPNQVFENPYVYGLFVLPFFKLTGLLAIPPIIFVLTTFGILIWFVTNSIEELTKRKLSLVLVLLVSPPLCLLFDRANIDLLIAMLIILAGWTFSREKNVLGLTILAIASLFKFYLLPIFMLIGLYKWRRSVLGLSFISIVCSITLLNYRIIDKSLFPSSWESSFGPGALSSIFQMGGLPHPSALSTITSFVIFGLVGSFTYRFSAQTELTRNRTSSWVFLISSSTFVLTCLFITTFSYRLFLVVLSLPIAITLIRQRLVLIVFIASLILGFFLNNPRGLAIEEIRLVIVSVGISNICLLILAGILLGLLPSVKSLLWNSESIRR